jgi:hypothetical protein
MEHRSGELNLGVRFQSGAWSGEEVDAGRWICWCLRCPRVIEVPCLNRAGDTVPIVVSPPLGLR